MKTLLVPLLDCTNITKQGSKSSFLLHLWVITKLNAIVLFNYKNLPFEAFTKLDITL